MGERARELGISMHGLASKQASLEEAFMEMTRDQVEYQAKISRRGAFRRAA